MEVPGAGAKDTPAVAPVTADALTPPVNDGFKTIDPSVENVSDVDLMSGPAKGGEKSAEAQAAEAKAAEEKAAADKAAADKAEAEKKDGQEGRYDKDPAWQRLLKERDEFKQELAEIKGQLKILSPADKKEVEAREDKQLPYKDITKMSKEQILEWQEDDPIGYAANLYQQMLHESREQIKAEQAEEARKATEAKQTASIQETFKTYEKDNPDFRTLWDSGEITKVMDKYPGIGAIGAHLLMFKEGEQARTEAAVKAAVDKAVKETEERIAKNFAAKRNAQVITDGGALKEEGLADELKNSEKYGGVVAAGAARLSRLRQVGAGG